MEEIGGRLGRQPLALPRHLLPAPKRRLHHLKSSALRALLSDDRKLIILLFTAKLLQAEVIISVHNRNQGRLLYLLLLVLHFFRFRFLIVLKSVSGRSSGA